MSPRLGDYRSHQSYRFILDLLCGCREPFPVSFVVRPASHVYTESDLREQVSDWPLQRVFFSISSGNLLRYLAYDLYIDLHTDRQTGGAM